MPGSANRIITLAETEAQHRRQDENRYATYRFLSLVLAFVLAIVVLSAGIYFVATGKSVQGLILLVTEVTLLAAVFLGRVVLLRDA